MTRAVQRVPALAGRQHREGMRVRVHEVARLVGPQAGKRVSHGRGLQTRRGHVLEINQDSTLIAGLVSAVEHARSTQVCCGQKESPPQVGRLLTSQPCEDVPTLSLLGASRQASCGLSCRASPCQASATGTCTVHPASEEERRCPFGGLPRRPETICHPPRGPPTDEGGGAPHEPAPCAATEGHRRRPSRRWSHQSGSRPRCDSRIPPALRPPSGTGPARRAPVARVSLLLVRSMRSLDSWSRQAPPHASRHARAPDRLPTFGGREPSGDLLRQLDDDPLWTANATRRIPRAFAGAYGSPSLPGGA